MNRFLEGIDKDSRKIVYACFFAYFFSGLFTLMMGSILPDMKLAYGLTDTQSGFMLSGHSIGNLLAGFLSGLVPLWLGRRRSIVALSTFTILGFALMLLFGNPLVLILAFICTGIGRGSVTNFNNGTVTRVTNGSPAASNLLHAFFAVGAFCGPMVFLLSSSIAGWRLAIGVILVIGVLVTFTFARMRVPDDRPDRKDKTQSSMVFLKNYSYLIAAGMMFCYLCAEYSINGWLVTYLQNKPEIMLAFSGSETALKTYSQTMATLLWVIILVGRLTCAVLSKKIPQKRLMMVMSAGIVVFFALLLAGASIPVVTIAVAGLGFCLAGICPMIYSDASHITNVYPMGTSTLLAIGSIGSIAMPSLVGMMADAHGFTGGMMCILVAVALLFILATLNVILPQKNIEKGDAQ